METSVQTKGNGGPFKDFTHLTPGAEFVRADLHIHSFGVSADVRDDQMGVSGIVSTAVERGLDVIAITDHNAIDAVSELLDQAPQHGLTAFAGVEITTGEGHVLVYFAPESYDAFSKWFGRLKFEEQDDGDKHTLVPIRELLEQVQGEGGVAIPAHVGRDNTGFLARVSSQIEEAILTSTSLVAVEVDRADEGRWYSDSDSDEGAQRRKELMKKRVGVLGEVAGARLPKLVFSDAHSLAAVGRDRDGNEKVTRIKMGKRSFDAFLMALADPDARIKLEADLPASYPRLVGARFIGGFLDEQEITFSPNLTCLIGGRGAGKSTAIDGVRCTCLSGPSEMEGEPNWPDTVQLIYRDQYGTDHYLKRDANRSTYELADAGVVETSIVVEGYDQDRIAAISRDYQAQPRLLLGFLDQFASLDGINEELAELAEQLNVNADAIRPLADAPHRLKEEERRLADLQLKLRRSKART